MCLEESEITPTTWGHYPLLCFRERVILLTSYLKRMTSSHNLCSYECLCNASKTSPSISWKTWGDIWKHMCKSKIKNPWLIMQVKKKSARICNYTCPRHFLLILLSALRFLTLLLVLNSWNANVATRCQKDASKIQPANEKI